MPKKALILGVGGMDGSYLVDILLEKDFQVHGLHRHSSVDNLQRIAHCRDKLTLHRGDITDGHSLAKVIVEVHPDEIYNEADQDHVGWSMDTPWYSADVTYGGPARLLEIVRTVDKRIKIFQPLSATMFGNAPQPQSETTPFAPQSPYACAKVGAYYLCRHYRREYGMFVATAILFNHESPRRGKDYLLQRICRQALTGRIELRGPLDLRIDIGYAEEYMRAAWSIMQLEEPDNFVIGTGQWENIKSLADAALLEAGHPDGRVIDVGRYPSTQSTLIANSRKAQDKFGFKAKTWGSKLVRKVMEGQ